MKRIQRIISFLLAVVIIIGMMPPMEVHAEETGLTETSVTEATEETTIPTEPEMEPAEETTIPTEPETEPTEETTVPTEPETEPAVETTVPVEEIPDLRVEMVSKEAALSEASAGTEVANGTCGDHLTWTLDAEGTLTISGTGTMTDFANNSSTPWYDHFSSIKSVVIEEGVTDIGEMAFSFCSSMTSLMLPESLINIGGWSIRYCTGLTSVTIPESVTTIERMAFDGCTGLTALTIPASVTSIGSWAMRGCTGLTEIRVAEDNENFSNDEYGVLFNKAHTTLIQAPCGMTGEYTVPSGVTSIGSYSFDHGALSRVTIPASVTSIGDGAFRYCADLTGIWVAESNAHYSSDDSGVLLDKAQTTLIQAPGSLAGEYAIPSGVTNIPFCAFLECGSMTSLTIPASVTSISYDAFSDCTGLASITFLGNAPAIGTSSIGTSAFENVTATAYYPANDATWTEDKLQNYGGTLTWEPYGDCEDGHTEVIDEAVAATCTESGLTEGSHCSVCGVILAAQEVIEPAGHRYEAAYVDPTFDADGFTIYTCSACGDAYTETDEGTKKSAAASIGSVKYETLAEAFAAATEDDTILMLKTYTIAKGAAETWDLSGKTLEISGNSGGISVEGDLTVLGGTFRFLEGAQGLMVWENGRVTIEDGTFHTVDSRGIWVVYGKITFNGGTFYVTGDGYIGTSERRAGSDEFAQFVINGGTFYFCDSGHFSDYGNSTIKGGTFYLESREGTIRADYSYHRDSLTITGGTFYISGPVGISVDPAKGHLIIKGGKFITISDDAQILEYDGGILGIYGGTFSQDMTPYLSNNYCCSKSGAYYVVGSHLYNLKNTSEDYLKTTADCTNPAEYYMSCACGKAGTNTFTLGEPLGHSFTNYVSNDNATCTENGTETASCNRACGTTDEREIPDSAKGHSYQDGICTVCGDENGCGDNLCWKFDADTGILTISGTGAMNNYSTSSPAPWNSYADQIKTVLIKPGLTEIGSYAFYYCSAMTSVSIPDTVTKISSYAFCGCSALTAVEIPDSVTQILQNAFQACRSLKAVEIPAGVTSIESAVFSGCTNLSEVSLPDGLLKIGSGAFIDCTSLAQIDIPDTVTNIYIRAFAECTSLVSVTIPSGVNTLSIYAFEKCTALERVTFAEGVSAIGYNAFDGCTSLAEVNLPESLTMIDDAVFYGCRSLTSIVIPAAVTTIGEDAFHNCYALKSVTLKNGLKTIGGEAFRSCAITELSIPSSVTKLGSFAFANCQNLTSITLPGRLSEIGNGAFYSCTGLETVTLSNGTKTIGAQAFQNCQALKSVTFPDTLEVINRYVFQDCAALESIVFPASVTTIDDDAFMGCTAMSRMTFLGSAPTMVNGCFRYVQTTAYYPGNDATWTAEAKEDYGGTITWICTDCVDGHTAVTDSALEPTCTEPGWTEGSHCSVCGEVLTAQEALPAAGHTAVTDAAVEPTCTEPGWTEGSHCSVCGEVLTAQEEIPAAGHQVENGVCTVCGMYGTCGETVTWEFDEETGTLTISGAGEMTKFANSTVTPWYAYVDQIKAAVIMSGVTNVGNSAFSDCGNLANIVIPEGVTSIGGAAFSGCSSLASVIIPEGVTSIGNWAFSDCSSLTAITIPAGVTNLGDYVFYGCNGLTSVTLPEGIAKISAMLFYKCSSLTGITIPASVLSIDRSAFSGCSSLTSIEILGSITSVGDGAFYGCSSLTGITIPDTVTSIGYQAFYGCTNLKSIKLPEGITSIDTRTFYGCHSLASINIPKSVTSIGDGAFSSCHSLTSLVLPEGSLIDIGNAAFSFCTSLTSITVPKGVTKIESNVFNGCTGLTNVVLPEGITSIGGWAFLDCTSLTDITIPATVTNIDGTAFYKCSGLGSISFLGDAPDLGSGVFSGMTATAYYPAGNSTWTEAVRQNYGGTITWVAVGVVENRVMLDSEELNGNASVWVDGQEYAVKSIQDTIFVDLPDGNAKTMVAYTYHVGEASDVHTQYPVSMKVWTLSNTDGLYTATRAEELDNILQYSGMSIRVTGKKGIRMITSVEKSKKNALVSDGLAGYTLKEYGTVAAWTNQMGEKPLMLGKSYAKSNYAYKKDVADPVFAYYGDMMQYTNVLVGFSNAQCSKDLAMRPYIILEDAEGNEITLYGGIVQRSIGYIACQNRNTFTTGSEAYEYVWNIIHSVYGDIYDEEYAA